MGLGAQIRNASKSAAISGHRAKCLPMLAKPLAQADQVETLAFLSDHPLRAFGMTALIRDNGLVSPLNRGTFYACRAEDGNIEGVALIGHNTLMEARTEASIESFAHLARACPRVHLVLGEEEVLKQFWAHYCGMDRVKAEEKRYVLLKQNWPLEVREPVAGLRPANLSELDMVIKAHIQSGIEQTGTNDSDIDPAGFSERCAQRIRRERTWIWTRGGKVVFKIEIIADTPELIYLESMWVAPEERNKGYSLRCLTQLGRELLMRSSAICLLAEESNIAARKIYKQAGYKNVGYYRAIFLQ